MFTDQMELMLLSYMVKDMGNFEKSKGKIVDEAFNNDLAASLFKIVDTYYREYHDIPSRDEVINEFNKSFRVAKDDNIEEFVNHIYDMEVNDEYVDKEINNFIRSRKLESMFRDRYEKVKSGEMVEISGVISELFKVERDTSNLDHMYGVGIDESDFIIDKGEAKEFIPTNIRYLNDILGGGLASGQLGIILAPPNYGKTMILLNFAIYAFLKKKNVLFVTLEMEEFSIVRRILHIMAGALGCCVNIEYLKKLSDHLGSKFMVLYKPMKTITVDYLYSVYHNAMASGLKFDAVFIDYADLLRASYTGFKDKRFELGSIFESLKGMSQILEVPVWSATQSNRDGMRAETVKMEHMSEDISKAFTSDVILSICNKLSEQSSAKLFLTKHREGKSDMFINTWVADGMWLRDDDDNFSNLTNV